MAQALTMNKIKQYLTSAFFGMALSISSQAENFMRGVRGPTDWQFDNRIRLTNQENKGTKTESFTDIMSIRYWNGSDKGIFGYIAIPYKFINAGNQRNNGLGDIGIGIGPRGSITNNLGSFHFLSTIGLQLPTGENIEMPRTGNGRTDLRFSLGITYLIPSQKTEFDASFDYIRAEKNASDDIFFGVAAGHQIHRKIKAGGGFLGNIKSGYNQDGEYKFTARGIARYTHSSKWHTELWLDQGISDKRQEATLVLRYNF